MGKLILQKSGGGGLDPDELTAQPGDVIKGKIAGVAGSDEPAAGTLELIGTAADSQVLTGQTYYNTDAKNKRTGSMPNRGAWTGRIGINGTIAVPAGYHNGAGYVDQSITNRGAWTGSVPMNGRVTVPEGYHSGGGYVNGPTVTQRGAWATSIGRNTRVTVPEGYHNGSGYVNGPSMTDKGAATYTPSTSNQSIGAGYYLTGAQTILGDANLQPHNIRYGVTIFGVRGTFSGAAVSPYEIFNRSNNANDKTGRLSLVQSNGYVGSVNAPQTPNSPHYFNCNIPSAANPSVTATARVNNAFNLAPYRYLKCGVYINDMQPDTIITLGVSANSAATSFTAQTTTSQNGTLILDVTNLNDNHFIFIKLSGTAYYIKGPHSILDINTITLSDS